MIKILKINITKNGYWNHIKRHKACKYPTKVQLDDAGLKFFNLERKGKNFKIHLTINEDDFRRIKFLFVEMDKSFNLNINQIDYWFHGEYSFEDIGIKSISLAHRDKSYKILFSL